MPAAKAIFTQEIFRFFRDLGKNNRKVWMDANRDRYQRAVVQPFRDLLEALSPALLEIDGRFEVNGRRGANFSRINRDIRFAKDKTLYKTQMYLKFSMPAPGNRENGELYAGLSRDVVTAGFRIYSGPKKKESTIALVARPRFQQNPKWVGMQKKRLGKKYESYWYAAVKGEWTKRDGWPTEPENCQQLQAWIVRRKMKPSSAAKRAFPRELEKVFREVYPLLKFTSIPD